MLSKPQMRGATLWRHPAFMRLWAAQGLSAFGNRITRTALPIIAISVLAVSPAEAALLSALGFAPVVVAGLAGGGLVERARKVRLMVMMDLLRFALVMAIPIAFALGVRSFWLLVLVSMAVSAASTLFQNADTSILPTLVSKSQLVEANSKLQTTESIAELAGPGAAGILVDVLTAPVAIIVDAVTFLWSAAWLAAMRFHAGEADAPGVPVAHGQSALAALREDVVVGFRAVMQRPALRALLFATVAFYVSAGFFFGLYMLFALRTLGLSASLVGVIVSMGGVSALGGAILARRVSRWLGFGPAIIVTFAIGMAGSALLLPAAIWPGAGAPLLFIQQLLSDGAFMAHMILASSLRQALLPPNEIARANGLFQAIGGIGMTVTTLLSGVIAEAVGVPAAVMIGAGCALLAMIPLISPTLLRMKDEPGGEAEPQPEMEEVVLQDGETPARLAPLEGPAT
ncbi:MAG: MFS transporter [Alphaproteobacteria bacterium]|nr:MFS transporter [Alphaproteobacteria bacterium]